MLTIHRDDNIIVALENLSAGSIISHHDNMFPLIENIPGKHKFAAVDFVEGDLIKMYGVTVGKAIVPILKGMRISRENVNHAATPIKKREPKTEWVIPDINRFSDRFFDGYHRSDGKVGTLNVWLIIPLVFCENRNIDVLKSSLLEPLGYPTEDQQKINISSLIQGYTSGSSSEELQKLNLKRSDSFTNARIFPNVDGIKFLKHEGGCGGIRQDSEALCQLLAGYIDSPNVAGATVLSLGCQNAQGSILRSALNKINPHFDKPLHILEQQGKQREEDFLADCIMKTFLGLIKANEVIRKPAPLSKLVLGLECGGSDGFSGISANPTLGYTSDLIVACGGSTILSEFPELNGVEQELVNRCTSDEKAEKFTHLMETYQARAVSVGSGFDSNPSPGNIKDGLVTDAMKSAGAAKKGGTSPVTDVLDYTEQVVEKGLNLLCTPGNDVESTTGLAGSGANLICFTTGLGTPTGNPITPVVKISSNHSLSERMKDIIDFNTGGIIDGSARIEEKGAELLEYLIELASGRKQTAAMKLGQDDFIPWKRGISL